MSTVSALIITYNEEKKIKKCLEGVLWADEIIVVDSLSNDKTVEIAQKFTNKVYTNKFSDFSSQKNIALSKATSDWILFLDADESVSSKLKEKILKIINSDEPCSGYYVKRETYIFGRLMKKGGHDRDYQLRFFKRQGSKFYQPVHEKVSLTSPSTGYINEPLLHYSTQNLGEYVNKLDSYTSLEARFITMQRRRVGYQDVLLRPIFRFFQKYILQQGFRDELEGFIFYLLSAFYDFVKYIKCWETIHNRQGKG